MTEQYDVAAARHHRVAEHLEMNGEIDDAAYHYGLVGENALKYALCKSGVAGVWNGARMKPRNTPMGKHLPSLTSAIQGFITDIQLHAVGRVGAELQAVVGDPAFVSRFQGWSLDIRYADHTCTPVSLVDCQRWSLDADLVLRRLVLMI
ncbi:hypothetical protein [uncultured Thiodictyon sp.]|jgi:hypothetical protein|uniref:hypothetical protein n=1 Tax=uncultured Thiodictyon sp. TaxID=1846217 RepID=UPI0025CF64A9|nr:hypothetical protein [uncultured Thiodictyon sp.]